MDNFNRNLDIVKGNVVPEEKINMIVDAHLNKHAPMDFCLKQLNMSEADFVKIVEQCKEKVKKLGNPEMEKDYISGIRSMVT